MREKAKSYSAEFKPNLGGIGSRPLVSASPSRTMPSPLVDEIGKPAHERGQMSIGY